jgi:hypothetical protein
MESKSQLFDSPCSAQPISGLDRSFLDRTPYLVILLTEASFKATYVATFLGSYMAGRYDKDCMNGHKGQPYAHQPVEDATFCANEAWKSYVEILGDRSSES